MRYLESVFGPCDDSPECESPIESAFYQAVSILGHIRNLELTVQAQHRVSGYRADFLINARGMKCPLCPAGPFTAEVIIECDGHDFHERTKEQASRDKARDRFLQHLGYTVFRFTGSDIWKDVFACASEAIEFLDDRVEGKSIDHWMEAHSQ